MATTENDLLAKLQLELSALRASMAERDRQLDALIADADKWQKRATELEAETAALQTAVNDRIERTPVGIMVADSAIYRDALADFAIRVLSGGVAVSFRETRP